MDIQDLLNILTAEQLEQLAALKKQEDQSEKTKIIVPPANKKRNQNRKPKKKLIENITGENHPKIPKKKNTKRTQLILGERENIFIKSPEKDMFKEDSLIDQKLFSGKIVEREKRKISYIDARCSQCENMYEDVPFSECYKDDNGYVFICEECVGKLKK